MAKKSFSIGTNLTTAMTETVLSAHEYSGELHIEIIPISKIELDPENPRELLLTKVDVINGLDKKDPLYMNKKAELDTLFSLSESILSQGLINPILVYKTPTNYQLVAGERRLLASLLAKKDTIQVKILAKKPSQLELSLLQWVENMERSDLTLGERLKNVQQIVMSLQESRGDEKITGLELAQAINISKTVAYSYMKVVNAPNDIKDLIQAGKIKNLEAACLILQAEEPLRTKLIELSIEGSSLTKMENLAKEFTRLPATHKPVKKGRPSEKISFHGTKNPLVAQAILESILKNPRFSHFQSVFEAIQWDNSSEINEAFKKLIMVLEKELK